jgi:uncharacterized protein (TIGR02646 family)
MIKVNRSAQPKSLATNASKWKTELLAAIASGVKKDIKNAFAKYGQKDVKAALELMFNDKCAYCESEISSVTYGHIEHFKPKAKYPSQTFTWANLLLACARCNDAEHKGQLFPSVAQGGPLVNPCTEDPDAYIKFTYDTKTRMARAEGKNGRGVKTVEIFGLNTRRHLVKRRSKMIRNLAYIRTKSASDPEAMNLIDEAKTINSEFSAWAKSLF